MKVWSDKVNAIVQALGNVPAAGVKNNYNRVDISENGQLRQRLANVRERYLNALISNLNDRFPADDLDLLDSFDILLNPARCPNAPAEI